MIRGTSRSRTPADEASMKLIGPGYTCSERNLTAAYITSDEVRERPREAGEAEDGRDPGGADDRAPVDRLAQQALPGVELLGEEVGADEVERRDDPEQLHDQRQHQRRDDGRGAVLGRGREQDRDRGDSEDGARV